MLERLVGLTLARQGVRLADDAARLAKVDKEIQSVRRSVSVSNPMALDHWPLPSLLDSSIADQLEDEVGHYARLMPEPAAER